MSAKHTPGPWEMRDDSTGQYVAIFSRKKVGESVICPVRVKDRANAARIVACVNACEGIDDPSAIPNILRLAKQVVEEKGILLDDEVGELAAAIAKAEGWS